MSSHSPFSLKMFDRVNVVGTSGSGKSTFARKVAALLGHPVIEMDTLYWEPNWKSCSNEVFFERLSKALDRPHWVLDGNYDRTAHIKWANATAVVWLDYSFTRNLYQSLKRALYRSFTRTELWPGTGNKESFVRSFLSRDSIILWMLQSHGKMRVRYAERMNDPKHSHISFFRVRAPAEVQKLLADIEKLRTLEP